MPLLPCSSNSPATVIPPGAGARRAWAERAAPWKEKPPDEEILPPAWFDDLVPLERTVAAFDGDLIVGTLGAFPFDVTVPGEVFGEELGSLKGLIPGLDDFPDDEHVLIRISPDGIGHIVCSLVDRQADFFIVLRPQSTV